VHYLPIEGAGGGLTRADMVRNDLFLVF